MRARELYSSKYYCGKEGNQLTTAVVKRASAVACTTSWCQSTHTRKSVSSPSKSSTAS